MMRIVQLVISRLRASVCALALAAASAPLLAGSIDGPPNGSPRPIPPIEGSLRVSRERTRTSNAQSRVNETIEAARLKVAPALVLLRSSDGGHGTGFVVSKKSRLIATAAHVADHAFDAGASMVAIPEGTSTPCRIARRGGLVGVSWGSDTNGARITRKH
jgi:S1-C subfamily serine protease